MRTSFLRRLKRRETQETEPEYTGWREIKKGHRSIELDALHPKPMTLQPAALASTVEANRRPALVVTPAPPAFRLADPKRRTVLRSGFSSSSCFSHTFCRSGSSVSAQSPPRHQHKPPRFILGVAPAIPACQFISAHTAGFHVQWSRGPCRHQLLASHLCFRFRAKLAIA